MWKIFCNDTCNNNQRNLNKIHSLIKYRHVSIYALVSHSIFFFICFFFKFFIHFQCLKCCKVLSYFQQKLFFILQPWTLHKIKQNVSKYLLGHEIRPVWLVYHRRFEFFFRVHVLCRISETLLADHMSQKSLKYQTKTRNTNECDSCSFSFQFFFKWRFFRWHDSLVSEAKCWNGAKANWFF